MQKLIFWPAKPAENFNDFRCTKGTFGGFWPAKPAENFGDFGAQKVLSGFQMLKKLLSGVPDAQKDTFGGPRCSKRYFRGSPDAPKGTFGGPVSRCSKRYFRGSSDSQKVLSGVPEFSKGTFGVSGDPRKPPPS